MAEDNVKAQMRKGILEYCILALLSREDSYTPRIISALKEAEMIVVEGTLYPILTRQKNAGLLTYRWEESPQGPPRKYYSLTDKGREYLAALDAAWDELVGQIRLIRHGKNRKLTRKTRHDEKNHSDPLDPSGRRRSRRMPLRHRTHARRPNRPPHACWGSGHLTTRTFDAPRFDGVYASSTADVTIVKGSGPITIEAGDNVMEYVVADVEAGRLRIKLDTDQRYK